MRWYAVMTRARMEDLAERNLKAQGYTTFYPHYMHWTTPTRAKPRELKKPYLTRYIFASVNGGPNESVYGINNTIGVSRVVYLGPEAFEIPEEIMDELMTRADKNGHIYPDEKPPEQPFSAIRGDKIKFSELSPFFGLIAEFEKVDRDGTLMVKLDKLLGQDRTISVPKAHVGQVIAPDGSLRSIEPASQELNSGYKR